MAPRYDFRWNVRPGLTGLAQVNGCRGETQSLEDMQARIEYDLDIAREGGIGQALERDGTDCRTRPA